ncbi:MAG: hydrogenase maturation peptidase HycI [Armatimonadota bacterium]|nr:hydrogenase maturation peptidase HycI [Armatimonadota bacterium]MCX7776590.1 hydrogenase maturation peptidase HycI [Armatimonadota bacterium]MDW8025267.1 hydrogenase maturation peptidase HycI [Armatimonadota bacterium]
MSGKGQIELFRQALRGRVAIIGIGNEMRGDDAVGCYIARRLHSVENALVIEAGDVPENYAGLLREYKPECIVLVDAVNVGADVGSIIIMSAEELSSSLAVSTHGMPLKLLSDYLRRETGAEVFLIGIQVKGTELGAPMSDEVQVAAEAIVELICSAYPTVRVRA